MRIYLDNAATSWPKPEAVYAAVDHYQREIGIAAGRGGYNDAVAAQRIVESARRELATLINAPNPNHIIHGCNGTDSLNLAIHGTLRPGDHVVASVTDHNSVLRPLADETRFRDVTVTYVGCDAQGLIDPDEVRRAIQPNTRMVIATHASNVTGAIQPLAEIAAVAKAADKLLMVDASQSAGHVGIDVQNLNIDLLAASGHKGLLGPPATGFLYIREGVEDFVHPTRQGGTGFESQLDRMPDELPTRYEAGSLNGSGLAGLVAALKYLRERTIANVAAHENMLVKQLWEGLESIPGVRLYGPPPSPQRGPVVSFSVEGYDPHEFSAALDAMSNIQSRAGLHCAPKMHQALGTFDAGGLVRMSVGWATSVEDINYVLVLASGVADP
ncbi:MAG: aminotransferase class V-fold PLP-dependent enzyme [Planctomycetaceae bacterium]|nr:aminotransferase class V-fold PLP-dependent enzyme [Planctomycetaceae bacterium]